MAVDHAKSNYVMTTSFPVLDLESDRPPPEGHPTFDLPPLTHNFVVVSVVARKREVPSLGEPSLNSL